MFYTEPLHKPANSNRCNTFLTLSEAALFIFVDGKSQENLGKLSFFSSDLSFLGSSMIAYFLMGNFLCDKERFLEPLH